jgi:ABC-type glutathione transport system ATPase component
MCENFDAVTRAEMLSEVAGLLPSRGLVGVDGVDGAGKTTFCDGLAQVLRSRGREVVRASVDDFHHPRAIRWQRGRTSPEGFFLDSYDYERFAGKLRRVLTLMRDNLRRQAAQEPTGRACASFCCRRKPSRQITCRRGRPSKRSGRGCSGRA